MLEVDMTAAARRFAGFGKPRRRFDDVQRFAANDARNHFLVAVTAAPEFPAGLLGEKCRALLANCLAAKRQFPARRENIRVAGHALLRGFGLAPDADIGALL